MSKNSIAWYVVAIKLTEIRLERRIGRIKRLGRKTESCWKMRVGLSNKRPIMHLENSNINRDEPSSNAVFAAVGTTAKHKDDRITIAIPVIFLEDFDIFIDSVFLPNPLLVVLNLLLFKMHK
jgi:hypothetical protein